MSVTCPSRVRRDLRTDRPAPRQGAGKRSARRSATRPRRTRTRARASRPRRRCRDPRACRRRGGGPGVVHEPALDGVALLVEQADRDVAAQAAAVAHRPPPVVELRVARETALEHDVRVVTRPGSLRAAVVGSLPSRYSIVSIRPSGSSTSLKPAALCGARNSSRRKRASRCIFFAPPRPVNGCWNVIRTRCAGRSPTFETTRKSRPRSKTTSRITSGSVRSPCIARVYGAPRSESGAEGSYCGRATSDHEPG